jgi:hypothetical protein
VVAILVGGLKCRTQFWKGTTQGSFQQSLVEIGSVVSEEKIFRNRPIKNKNCLWRPSLLLDRDKMGNLHRGPSIDASYPVSPETALPNETKVGKMDLWASSMKIAHFVPIG